MELPTLVQFTYSHFNEKARWALDFKHVPHRRRSLLPGSHILEVRRLTGQSSLPALMLEDAVIHDSTRIIEALEQRYPEPPLYPTNAAERKRALELEEFFDEQLGPYDRLWFFHLALPYPDFIVAAFAGEASAAGKLAFRASFPMVRLLMKRAMRITPARAQVARDKTIAALDLIERELGSSDYLVGNRFTVADLTAAALLSPLVAPPEFPYRSSVPPPPPVAAVQAELSNRPAFQWVRTIYQRHRGVSSEIRL